MKADLLTREFTPRRATPGGDALLLLPGDALALIDRASEEGVPIVRVDGFTASGGQMTPSPEHSADYASAVAEGHGCWTEAEAFVRSHAERQIVFHLALGDDPVEVV